MAIGYILQEPTNERDKIIKATIRETFKELAVLADSLVEAAKDQTKTREEYIAFLHGAAFMFYNVCTHDDTHHHCSKIGKGIITVQDAINHCNDLLPFMEPSEKEEHIKLMNWLNELLERRGEKKIDILKLIIMRAEDQAVIESLINKKLIVKDNMLLLLDVLVNDLGFRKESVNLTDKYLFINPNFIVIGSSNITDFTKSKFEEIDNEKVAYLRLHNNYKKGDILYTDTREHNSYDRCKRIFVNTSNNIHELTFDSYYKIATTGKEQTIVSKGYVSTSKCWYNSLTSEDNIEEVRFANRIETLNLFSGLESEGLYWNIKARSMERLKYKFSLGKNVLVRNSDSGKWEPDIFFDYTTPEQKEEGYKCLGLKGLWKQVIPYEKRYYLLYTKNKDE